VPQRETVGVSEDGEVAKRESHGISPFLVCGTSGCVAGTEYIPSCKNRSRTKWEFLRLG